jgi:protein-tyrosine phosphatase
MAHSILFVCTGNVFRSMVAEHAMREQLGPESGYLVGSAGIEAKPQMIHPVILARMMQKGADPSRHVQHMLTREMVDQTDLLIVMGLNHREFIERTFGRTAPLFNEISFGTDVPILDVHEALPDWEQDLGKARAYVESVVDHIWNAVPSLLTRLPRFL